MKGLKIAATHATLHSFITDRMIVDPEQTDFTDVGAVVLTTEDMARGLLDKVIETQFDIPLFALLEEGEILPACTLRRMRGVINKGGITPGFFGKQVDVAASEYEEGLLPPFFKAMTRYCRKSTVSLTTPGHHSGQFFRQTPAGRRFFDYFGETVFQADMTNRQVKPGDLLIHEGAACQAEKHAADVFNADKTYFVLNGTSAANRVVASALLAPGDLVLFDRNNHKSCHHGALLQAGATPVYLPASRNPYGFIGGIDSACLQEAYLRKEIKTIAPDKQDMARPFRLAIIQSGTYDGCIYNARQVIDKIGHLCDYILFDAAWVGYEQFIPMIKACSPLQLALQENDPGIFVTQSVHKVMAGFSQASQIHKKDRHIKGKASYCNHKHINNAFMLHTSTSPHYPIFASLDVNARMHKGKSGIKIWTDAVKVGIEARKLILQTCRLIKPFIPPMIDGTPWQAYDTEAIANDRRFFSYQPGEAWHAYEGFAHEQYFADPCKLMLTTPGIDMATGEYAPFGVPAAILCHFLHEHGITPEKSDLNAILLLITPSCDLSKIQQLVALLVQFEQLLEEDAPLRDVLPTIYAANSARYQGYTLRQLCQEMHNIYLHYNMKELQKALFRKATLPKQAMLPYKAHQEFVRNHAELVPLKEIEGRVAAEGALPYPPGIICIVPGEIWGGAVLEYFRVWENLIDILPGFAPELQGVYMSEQNNGRVQIFGYVIK